MTEMAHDEKQSGETNSNEMAAEEYHLGCSFIALQEYKVAMKYFNRSVKIRGGATPDLHRNLGWCQYRIAEYEAFHKQYEKAKAMFNLASENYSKGQAGFEKSLHNRASKDVSKKIKDRISDCQKRITSIEALKTFLKRQEKFEQRST